MIPDVKGTMPNPNPIPHPISSDPHVATPESRALRAPGDDVSSDDDLDIELEHGAESHLMRDLSRRTLDELDGQADEEDEEDEPDQEERRFLRGKTRASRRSSVQSFELYTPDEEARVVRKLDRRVVWFMALLYMLSFLDRSNIGNAKIAGMEKDLDLTSSQYEWLLTAFYITYIAFEWMTLMYRLLPAHIYISICVLSWGIIASIQSLILTYPQLFLLRLLLGITEAAFGPGVPFYLSFFYRRSELAFRTGLFISAAPLSSAIAGSLAWCIVKASEGGRLGIASWRLLFLLEGFPSVIAAVVAWEVVPDGPGTAKFLDEREKKVAVLRMRGEEREKGEKEKCGGAERRMGWRERIKWAEIGQTLRDPKAYMTAAMFFLANIAFSSTPVFLPTIIRSMGFSSLSSQALTLPPYLLSFILTLLSSHLSDTHRVRSTPLLCTSLLSAVGYLLLTITSSLHLPPLYRYLPLLLACPGFFASVTLIITWSLNNQESSTGRGTGIAVVNLLGQLGPLVGTRLFPEGEGPWFVKGMGVCAGCMALVGGLSWGLGAVLKRENGRRAREWEARRRRGGRAQREEQGSGENEAMGKPFLFIV